MKKRIVLVLISFIFLFSYASAQNFRSITADDVKNMLDKKEKLVLVDARTSLEYRQGHIPKAINIPPEKLATLASALPKNKKTLIIFYCRGVA